MNKYFWRNKVVLLTGCEGFLGSNLAKRLVSYGAKIVGLDIKVKRNCGILSKEDYGKIIIIKGDVAKYSLIKEIITRYKIEIVFHLAAEAIVKKCTENPLRTFSSNIQGTWNVLEACRNVSRIKAIIIASSDKAYGTHTKLPYREDASLIGRHPYDVSKSCADLISHAYFNTYNLPVGVTRCGNIYGPGDFNFTRIIPDAIRCLLWNKPIIIRSDGKFIRDYIYIDDIVNGYILLAEKLRKLKLGGEAFNFGDENPITVVSLIKMLCRLAKIKPDYKILNQAQYEIRRQYLSSQKARTTLGWKPKYGLEDGLRRTFEWYRNCIIKKNI